MGKTALILDIALIFSSLAAYVFLGLAEDTSMRLLKGQAIPSLTKLAYQYKSLFIVAALIVACGNRIKIIRGSLKETDVILYMALTLLFISVTLFISLIAAILPHMVLISPLR